jgi:hypothetical protein
MQDILALIPFPAILRRPLRLNTLQSNGYLHHLLPGVVARA